MALSYTLNKLKRQNDVRAGELAQLPAYATVGELAEAVLESSPR